VAVDQEQLIRGLLQVAESLISDLPLEARLTDLCRTTVQLLRCDRSSIFLREGRYYRAKCNHGNPPDIAPRFPQFKVSLRDPLISRAMETRSFVVVNDAHQSPLMNAQTARRARIQSIVVAPLFDDRRGPLGFITAEYNENFGVFTEAMSTLVLGLAKLGELVCLAHQHAAERERAEEALRRLNRTSRAISECNQAVVRATSEPELLEAICRIVVERGGYRMVWVGFAEADEAKTVRPVAHAGVEEGYLDVLHVTYADTERGRGPTGTAIRERRVFTCRDVLSEPRFAPWRDEALKRGYASVIALPLLRDGKAFGTLNIYSARPDAFDAEEESLLTELTNDLAYGITALRTRAEHERAEAALRRSEDHFRALIENSSDVILVVDRKGTVGYASPSVERVLGYKPEEAIGRSGFDTIVPADIPRAIAALGKAILTKEVIIPNAFRVRRKDGSERILEGVGKNLLDDPAVAGFIMNVRDVTERKRAEAEQAALFEIAKDIAGVVDLNDILKRVHQRVATVLPCGSVITYYWDDARNAYRALAWHGVPPRLMPDTIALELHPSRPVTERLLTGEPVLINEVANQSLVPLEILTHFGLTAVVLVPLVVRGRMKGVLAALNAESGRRFDPHQVRLLEGIAQQVGVAIEAVDLYHAQEEEAAIAGALARVGQELISSLSSPALLDRLCQLTAEVLGCDHSHTWLWHAPDETFVPVARWRGCNHGGRYGNRDLGRRAGNHL
jgi:PAS domain S-box-containing protein